MLYSKKLIKFKKMVPARGPQTTGNPEIQSTPCQQALRAKRLLTSALVGFMLKRVGKQRQAGRQAGTLGTQA